MRISDWSSDVCSSDLRLFRRRQHAFEFGDGDRRLHHQYGAVLLNQELDLVAALQPQPVPNGLGYRRLPLARDGRPRHRSSLLTIKILTITQGDERFHRWLSLHNVAAPTSGRRGHSIRVMFLTISLKRTILLNSFPTTRRRMMRSEE